MISIETLASATVDELLNELKSRFTGFVFVADMPTKVAEDDEHYIFLRHNGVSLPHTWGLLVWAYTKMKTEMTTEFIKHRTQDDD
jgi:hypothetical protein